MAETEPVAEAELSPDEAPEAPEDGVSIVNFADLPFGWVDAKWEIAMVVMPDGQAASCLILTTPLGQFGIFFGSDALMRLGAQAVKVSNKARSHLLVASPAALQQLDDVMARGRQVARG